MGKTTGAFRLHRQAVSLWPDDRRWDERSARFRATGERLLSFDIEELSSGRKRVDIWFQTLDRHETFWRSHRHRPREKTRDATTLPDDERRLGEWARYQRRFDDQLCHYQILRLDVSPSFTWDPQTEAWQANLDACIRFARITGQLPRLHSASSSEFVLARWLGRQLRQLQSGTLHPTRANAIGALLSGYSG